MSISLDGLYAKFQQVRNEAVNIFGKTPDVEKAKKCFEKCKSAIVIDGNSPFITRVENEIKLLMQWKVGRALFKKTINKDTKIQIEEGLSNQYDSERKVIRLCFDDRYDAYYCALDENGQIGLQKYPSGLGLAHEMIHKYLRNGVIYRSDINLFRKDFDYTHEQEVITGWGEDAVQLINENFFLYLCGFPFRVNHKGLFIPKNEEPSIVDAFLTYRQEITPSLVNTPFKFHRYGSYSDLEGKLILPLTAAVLTNDPEYIKKLVNLGAKINGQDENGTALSAAIRYNKDQSCKILLELGAGKAL